MITALAIALLVTVLLLGWELTYSFYHQTEEHAEIDERLRQVTQ